MVRHIRPSAPASTTSLRAHLLRLDDNARPAACSVENELFDDLRVVNGKIGRDPAAKRFTCQNRAIPAGGLQDSQDVFGVVLDLIIDRWLICPTMTEHIDGDEPEVSVDVRTEVTRVRMPPASMKCCLKETPFRSAQTLEKLFGCVSLKAASAVQGQDQRHQPTLADRLHLPQDHRLGWYYLSTVLDDFSRYIVAWRLGPTMCASDVTATLDQALAASGLDYVNIKRRFRAATLIVS